MPDSFTTIHIRDMKVDAIIGTLPHERERAQTVVVNVTFSYDASLAASTDALGHAIDYAAMHAKITEKVAASQFLLLERLVAYILDIVMEENRIVSAAVTVEKRFVLSNTSGVSVTASRQRGDIRGSGTLRCY